jgi:hypothetical protein
MLIVPLSQAFPDARPRTGFRWFRLQSCGGSEAALARVGSRLIDMRLIKKTGAQSFGMPPILKDFKTSLISE